MSENIEIVKGALAGRWNSPSARALYEILANSFLNSPQVQSVILATPTHSVAEILEQKSEIENTWYSLLDGYVVAGSPQYFERLKQADDSISRNIQRELGWLGAALQRGLAEVIRVKAPRVWALLMINCPSTSFSFEENFGKYVETSVWQDYLNGVELLITPEALRQWSEFDLRTFISAYRSPAVDLYRNSWQIELEQNAGPGRSWGELLHASALKQFQLRQDQYVPITVDGVLFPPRISEAELQLMSLWKVKAESEQFFARLVSHIERVVCRESPRLAAACRSYNGEHFQVAELLRLQISSALQAAVLSSESESIRKTTLRALILQLKRQALEFAYDEQNATDSLMFLTRSQQRNRLDQDRKELLSKALQKSVRAKEAKQRSLLQVAILQEEYVALGGSVFDLSRSSALLEDSLEECVGDLRTYDPSGRFDGLAQAAFERIQLALASFPEELLALPVGVMEASRVVQGLAGTQIRPRQNAQLDSYLDKVSNWISGVSTATVRQFGELPYLIALRLESFIVEVSLRCVAAVAQVPADATIEESKEIFIFWLERQLAQRLSRNPSFALALHLRNPALLYDVASIGDIIFDFDSSDTARRYIDSLVTSYLACLPEHSSDAESLERFDAVCRVVRSPYVDGCASFTYPLNQVLDQRLGCSLAQSLEIPAALRTLLQESFCVERDMLFTGTAQSRGWFAQAFFWSLHEHNRREWGLVMEGMLNGEFRELQELAERYGFRETGELRSLGVEELEWRKRHDEMLAASAVLVRELQAVESGR